MILRGKTVVITGGSGGLGFSLAKEFVKKDAKVCLVGRDDNRLEKAKDRLGKMASSYVADVSKLSQVEKVAKQVKNASVLINNAGVWIEGLVTENSEEKISEAIDINLKGVIFTTKVFLPQLQKRSEAHIVNISSTSGLRGRSNESVYVASKFGVTGFTDSLKVDLANSNVKVSGFYPGGMRTSLFEKAGTPKDNADWMDTDKVAEIIAFIVENDASMVLDHVVLNKRKTKLSN